MGLFRAAMRKVKQELIALALVTTIIRRACLDTRPCNQGPMKPVLMAVGAFLLVLGVLVLPLGSSVVSIGLFKAELQYSQSTTTPANSTSVYTQYVAYADQAEMLAILGAILAPVGAALLVYGLAEGRNAGKEKQVPSPMEPTPA
jgi:hypothetical protein